MGMTDEEDLGEEIYDLPVLLQLAGNNHIDLIVVAEEPQHCLVFQ